jgi:competence protein ComEC
LQVAIETIAAQLATLPLILFIFGNLSIISILANLMVVPLIPIAMLATLAAGVAGMLVPTLAGWIAVPANYLMSYMVQVIQILASLPWAQVPLKLGVIEFVVLVASIIAAGIFLWWRLHYDYLQTTVID